MISVIALTGQGLNLARRLAEELGEAECLGPAGRAQAPCQAIEGGLAEEVGRLFRSRQGLVFIAAAGLVVRLIAPHLKDKRRDPAVVVVDQAGRFAVSLLSGHLGGANRLAEQVAGILGGQAVVTTATDVAGLPGWDLLAQEADLVVDNPGLLARLTGAWLDGRRLALIDPQGRLAPDLPQVDRFETPEEVPADYSFGVYVGERVLAGAERLLLLRPRCLSLGLGCHRQVTLEELEAALAETLAKAGLSPSSLARLASIDRRRDAPALFELAEKLGAPLVFFRPEELAAIRTPNPSPRPARHVGSPSVAEAAALAGWGEAKLIVEKSKWPNLTLALARVNSI